MIQTASKMLLICCAYKKQLFKQSNFSWDYLTIYDGSSNASPMIGKFCGAELPPRQISSSNEVFIHFHTNFYRTRKGFKLEYHPYSKYF